MRRVLIIALLLVALPVMAAQAAPPALPASYYGTVRVNGAGVPEGAVLSVRVNGIECARAEVLTDEAFGSVYALNVPGAGSGMLASDGGAAGDPVTFVLELSGGEQYSLPQTAIWQSGGFQELSLRYPPEQQVRVVLPLILIAY